MINLYFASNYGNQYFIRDKEKYYMEGYNHAGFGGGSEK